MEERKSQIIYHRKILMDKSKSQEERKASRKILLKLLEEIEEIKDNALRKEGLVGSKILNHIRRLR